MPKIFDNEDVDQNKKQEVYMKPDLLNHTFHGKVEPIRNSDMTLPTVALEGIEVAVFIAVIYFIFARFWFVKTKKEETRTAEATGGIPIPSTAHKK